MTDLRYILNVCGRGKLTATGEDLRRAFGLHEVPHIDPHWNLAPTQNLAVIRTPGELTEMRFGLLPRFARDPKEGTRFINARVETVTTQSAYRDAFAKRRCLVVLDGFYEWQKDGKAKQPYLFERADHVPFALAGVWERWTSKQTGEVIDSVAIITCPALPPVLALHDREPVQMPPDTYDAWLDPGTAEPMALLRAGGVELGPAGLPKAMNSPKNDGPECVAPAEAS